MRGVRTTLAQEFATEDIFRLAERRPLPGAIENHFRERLLEIDALGRAIQDTNNVHLLLQMRRRQVALAHLAACFREAWLRPLLSDPYFSGRERLSSDSQALREQYEQFLASSAPEAANAGPDESGAKAANEFRASLGLPSEEDEYLQAALSEALSAA